MSRVNSLFVPKVRMIFQLNRLFSIMSTYKLGIMRFNHYIFVYSYTHGKHKTVCDFNECPCRLFVVRHSRHICDRIITIGIKHHLIVLAVNYIWFHCLTSQLGPLFPILTLQWRHNGLDSVSNHQPHDCLLICLFRRRWKKTPKLRVTGLCVGNSPVAGEFPAQMASNAENVSIWWRHHGHLT